MRPLWTGKRYFVFILSGLLIAGFLTVSLVSYKVAEESVSSQIADDALPLTSNNIYSEIQQDLLRPIWISSQMAHDTFVIDWAVGGEKNPEKMIHYLKEIQNRYGATTSFFVSERTHRYYHPKGIIKTVSKSDPQDAWYFRVRGLPDGKDYEINIDTDTSDKGRINVFINYRVYDYAGKLIGVTGVGLGVNRVQKLIETYQERYGRTVFFTDLQGNITLHGSGFKGGALSLRDLPGIKEDATRILTTPGGSYTYRQDNKTIYLNTRLVPEFQWYLIVEQRGSPADKRLTHTLLGNLLLSLGVTVLVLFLANLTMGRYQRRLERMASIDKLTGAANRQVFEVLFEQVLNRARRNDEEVSLIMLDLDHFKEVNDNHGHLAGDLVLKTVSRIVREQIRASDTLCRWGGEEFMILMPMCNIGHARVLAERIRQAIEQQIIVCGTDAIKVCVSLGVAQLTEKEDSAELIRRADRAMYVAKTRGRNCVSIAEPF